MPRNELNAVCDQTVKSRLIDDEVEIKDTSIDKYQEQLAEPSDTDIELARQYFSRHCPDARRGCPNRSRFSLYQAA